MKRVSAVAVLFLVVALAGCYHAIIDTGRAPSGQTIDQPWAMSFVGGLIPPPVVETMSQCPDGVARVETQHSILNVIVGGITGGIITPMHITVHCASGGMDDDADTIDIDPTDPMGWADGLNEAAARASLELKPVYVRATD
jgi:hypothetical protein